MMVSALELRNRIILLLRDLYKGIELFEQKFSRFEALPRQETLSTLYELANENDAELRQHSVIILLEFADEDIKLSNALLNLVIRELDDLKFNYVGILAYKLVGKTNPPLITKIIAIIKSHKDNGVRAWAICVLGYSKDPRSREVLEYCVANDFELSQGVPISGWAQNMLDFELDN